MDNVVDLEGKGSRRGGPAGRRRRSRSALVIGGGGFTGGVYAIGALRALDLLSPNRSVNEFDVYVGTSAGSLVAALAANGVTPEQMMQVVDDQAPPRFAEVDLDVLLRLNLRELAARGVRLPLHVARVLHTVGRNLGSFSLADLVTVVADALPSGVYDGSGIEDLLRLVLADPEYTDDFRELACELYLAATDLDTCERIVLGARGWDDVPISAAVRASAALPMVYQPHEIKGRALVDGGIISTANLDLAVEAGANLIVVINPLVPFVDDPARGEGEPAGRRVTDMGFAKVGFQAFKLLAYQRLHEEAGRWRERYPGVDIVLIEPERDDELMFRTSVLDHAARVEVARHGFRSVTLRLAQDYEALREVGRRHGIEISATRVHQVVRHFAAEAEKGAAWRRILEQTTGALLRQSAGAD